MSAFNRLVKIVRFDLMEEGRTGDPIPAVELQVSVKPNDLRLGLKLGDDNEDFIPGVAIQSSTTVDGGHLDDLAERMMDDLVQRALRVGRMESEPRIRPARGR